jgi:hypothetical protein
MTGKRQMERQPPGPSDHLPVPTSVPEYLLPIGEELSRLEESARYSAQVQFEAAKSWHRWNLALGVPASIFGLFTSGAAFTGRFDAWIVGTCALIGAALAGAMTVLGAERRATRAKTCANTFHDIQDDARRLLNIDLCGLDHEGSRAALTALTDRYSEPRQTADAPAKRFYDRAKNNLAEGGQQFAIDASRIAQRTTEETAARATSTIATPTGPHRPTETTSRPPRPRTKRRTDHG